MHLGNLHRLIPLRRTVGNSDHHASIRMHLYDCLQFLDQFFQLHNVKSSPPLPHKGQLRNNSKVFGFRSPAAKVSNGQHLNLAQARQVTDDLDHP